MIEMAIRAQLDELRERFDQLSEGSVGRSVSAATWSTLYDWVQHVVETKLTGQVLNRRTGAGILSVTASPNVKESSDRVRGTWGSNLGYMKAHEEGFEGTVTVPAHQVRAHRVKAREVRAHTRNVAGNAIQVRAHQVRAHQIRAHTRRAHQVRLDIRARRFLEQTMRERIDGVDDRVRRALYFLLRTGRPPSAAEIGS